MKAHAAAAALLVLLCACSPHTPGTTLRIADVANPTSLNPLLAHDQETIGNDLLVTPTLTGLDERNRVIPILLTRVPSRANGDVSADGTRITYHLRHGVRFADGAELTSADVAFTYRAIMDPRNPVLSEDSYRRIAALTVPDRYTVTVQLKRPWNAAVNHLFAESDFAFGILPAHAFAGTLLSHASWENHAFGAGPFRVTQWRRGDRIVLEPNPYYSPKPKLARIELRMVPDINTAFIALRTHEVDIAALRNPQLVAQARQLPGISVLRTPLNDTEYLDVQTSSPPTRDVRVRRAIAMALDMTEIRKAFEDVYPQAGSFLPPVMSGAYDPSIRPYPHDAAAARAVAKTVNGDLTLVLQADNPVGMRIATIVQRQLDEAGFTVNIKPFPTATFNAPEGPIRNARFSLSFAGWLGGADPEQSIEFTCAQATRNGNNVTRFCDPAFDAAFADQAVTRDPVRRRRDFFTMQRIVHDQVPQIPLYYETWYDGVDARVHGFERNMLMYPVAPETWSVSR